MVPVTLDPQTDREGHSVTMQDLMKEVVWKLDALLEWTGEVGAEIWRAEESSNVQKNPGQTVNSTHQAAFVHPLLHPPLQTDQQLHAMVTQACAKEMEHLALQAPRMEILGHAKVTSAVVAIENTWRDKDCFLAILHKQFQ